ncbi:DUF7453 family protein [Adhaeretor mobilis]|nr:choice-of-anchor tandem repeat NxxGxxAF-containing protein [Adhaeretor mobilis]
MLVQSGDVADDAAIFAGFSAPVIIVGGEVAFMGNLETGVSSVTTDNDTGVWAWKSGATSLVSREGLSSVPGASGARFDSFLATSLGVSGEVLVHGQLKTGVGGITTSNHDGVWDLGASSTQLVRTGATIPAGVSSSSFTSIGAPLLTGSTAATLAHLQLTVPDVDSTNDKGIWTHSADQSSSLVARTNVTSPPAVPGGTFSNLVLQAANENGQSMVYGRLEEGPGGVAASNRLGLWRMDSSGGTLVARQSDAVAGVSASKFGSFDTATINSSGQVAFDATLQIGGGTTTSNDRGVWLYDGSASTLLAREGDSVPEVPAATFAGFSAPRLNDVGQTLVQADLNIGVGGVTAADAGGLWLLEADPAQSQLIARLGSGGVPDMPGADFSSFDSSAFNSLGQVALSATLAVGGSVNSNNDQGLWLIDTQGGSMLIARKGDVLAGETIESIKLADGYAAGTRGLSDAGDVVFLAEFASGGSGLFLYESELEFLSSDFNFSNVVDGDDLAIWQANYGGALAADANGDGRSNGGDLLVWQQQYSPVGQLIAIPEPVSGLLLLFGCIAIVRQRTTWSLVGRLL